jgi:hypothetical protein
LNCRLTTILRALLAITVANGCASTPPGPGAAAPSRPSVSVVSSSVDSSATPPMSALSVYQPGNLRYDYRLHTVVQATAGDTTPRTDSSQVTAVFTETFLAPIRGEIEARVHVDSVVIVSLNSTLPAQALPEHVFTLRINATTGQQTFIAKLPSVRQRGDSCSDKEFTSPFQGSELLPTIRPGIHSWADSSVSSQCFGGVSLEFRRKVSYQELGPISMPLGIVRVTEAVVSGHGSQWGQPVEIAGNGTSIDTLSLAPPSVPARIQRLTRTTRLVLSFQSTYRSQQFLQLTTATAILRQ